jgi:hypothetical protein
MTRCDIDAGAASGYLRRVSHNPNAKLEDIAVDVAASRQLPPTTAIYAPTASDRPDDSVTDIPTSHRDDGADVVA